MSSKGSKIFLPNRALGNVSNHVPLEVRYIKSRKENLIVTCVGKSFHTYGISHFTLLSVSGLHPDDINCMASDTFHIYTACKTEIYAWRRGTELKHVYRGHDRNVHILLPFGPHLLSIDECSLLKIWNIKSEELYLELPFKNENFKISSIVHPLTYINKIVLGSEQGHLQLWNINKGKLVYTFKGWNSGVSCLEQAPAIDVIGIGLKNGNIILHNLKYDETIVQFTQDWGIVSTISFRTDGHPIMATGSLNGNIVFWNLEERRVSSQLTSAHDSGVTGMQCIHGEPLMVTSSPDNTLKLWIFDMTDGGARLLRIREGHSAPPTSIKFHGIDGHNILSAAADSSLRIFSTLTETFNKSLGKASYNRKISKKKGKAIAEKLKMPPITNFATSITREKEWDNIAAIHLGLTTVTLWSYDKLKMGERKLISQRFKKGYNENQTATCICLTHCGNFAIVGYSSGHVDRFNVQSGILRCTYGDNLVHLGPVRGVAVDILNKVVVVGAKNKLWFWRFKDPGTKPIINLTLDASISFIREGPADSSLLCVALEDCSCVLVDIEFRNIIRAGVLGQHSAPLTDAAFSPDARWLVTTGTDCIIKTWDVACTTLVDQFQVDAACTSLSFSQTGEYLATSHVDYLGIFLWSNRTLYSHVSLCPIDIDAEAPTVVLPGTMRDDSQDSLENLDGDYKTDEFISPEQIDKELLTLSGLATSRWQNLLNIDVIKQRNKPKAPPKKPKAAPFFLPTVPSLNFQFDLNQIDKDTDSHLLVPNNFENLSVFGNLLNKSAENNNFSEIVEKLKTFSPSMIDFEINNLAPDLGGSDKVMLQMLKLIEFMLQSNKDFELAQAYLGVFLKKHGAYITQNENLAWSLIGIKSIQAASWKRLEDKLMFNLCVVESLKNAY